MVEIQAEFEFKDRYNQEDLLDIMARLRSKDGGCPWDMQQTHASIKKNFIEETYEVIEAINKDDKELLCEELGDVLLQVVFHAQMAAEEGAFDYGDVVNGICAKLIERHPHIFADVRVKDSEEVLSNWDAIKQKSKNRKSQTASMLSVPRELPALMRSAKIQKKAADVSFDWPDVSGALQKLEEETEELKHAIALNDKASMQDELGDVLFSAVNISRFIKCDAEEALTLAADKFLKRFSHVEALAAARNMDMKSSSPEELDRLWEESKKSD